MYKHKHIQWHDMISLQIINAGTGFFAYLLLPTEDRNLMIMILLYVLSGVVLFLIPWITIRVDDRYVEICHAPAFRIFKHRYEISSIVRCKCSSRNDQLENNRTQDSKKAIRSTGVVEIQLQNGSVHQIPTTDPETLCSLIVQKIPLHDAGTQ